MIPVSAALAALDAAEEVEAKAWQLFAETVVQRDRAQRLAVATGTAEDRRTWWALRDAVPGLRAAAEAAEAARMRAEVALERCDWRQEELQL